MADHRIALYTPRAHGGGVERVVTTIANGLASEGFTVDCGFGNAQGVARDWLNPTVDCVDLRALPLTFPSLASVNPVLISRLRKYLRSRRPSAVVSFDLTGIPVLLAQTGSRVTQSTVLTCHFSINAFPLFSRNLARVARYSFPRATSVIAVSEGVANELTVSYGVPDEKIQVIPNPVDWDAIDRAFDDNVPPHPWLDGKGTPTLVAVGRLAPQKDLPTLLKAVRFLRHRGTAVRCLILGDGPMKASLKNLSVALGIQRDVEFLGWVKNPYSFMKYASVFVLSSRFEGFPNVLVEAIGVGCPVVTTDSPHGPREIVEHAGCGQLVPVGNPNTLAQAIALTLRDRPSETLLNGARDRVRSWTNVKQIARLYADATSSASDSSGNATISSSRSAQPQ